MSAWWNGLRVGLVSCVLTGASAPASDVAGSEQADQKWPESWGALVPLSDQAPLYAAQFNDTPLGKIPAGWRDMGHSRPNPNWAVDGKGRLRFMTKNAIGILRYGGALADDREPNEVLDVKLTCSFTKTEDDPVQIGLVGRLRDERNYWLARFSGDNLLEICRIVEGQEEVVDKMATLRRYRHPAEWKLVLATRGPLLSAAVLDENGVEMVRVDARDESPEAGAVALRASPFVAVSDLKIESITGYAHKLTPAEVAARNHELAAAEPDYVVVLPAAEPEKLNTDFDDLNESYDIVIGGAGTGGTAAAVQAARLGAKVLLLEETDWIGGQMSAAAVTTMDESSVHRQFPVRERGIYREFHESMVNYYYTRDKDPYRAYYAWPEQLEGGYEPRVTRAVLYGLIDEARSRGAVLDVCPRTRIVEVQRDGDTVRGVTIEHMVDASQFKRRPIQSKVLIDATEYGDVIPLTGARYRVGNVTSDNLDPAALVQDHTWSAVIKEYPGGLPEHLKIKSPPPGYKEYGAKRFRKFQHSGVQLWGTAGKGIKGPRVYRVFLAWRGMADSSSPMTGMLSQQRHTRSGINGGNDYPVTVATIEDAQQRALDERFGIYRTLQAIYYLQHELGLNWGLAEDEGYDTPYNRWKMDQLDLEPELRAVAVHMPQVPYVRESRRIIGLFTLKASDLTRFEHAKHFSTSVAMGDYFMDLDHGRTAQAIEADLDSGEPERGSGPFQVPFEVFIPEQIDGFIPAEKNISQSRLASGATRLQPITMLTGQAAGTIAALAVQQDIQPRQLNPVDVQAALLDAGCTLIQRWHADVPWGTEIWKATQLLALYQVLDRPGPIDGEHLPLGAKAPWGVDQPLAADEFHRALSRLLKLHQKETVVSTAAGLESPTRQQVLSRLAEIDQAWAEAAEAVPVADAGRITGGEFALMAAAILRLN